MTSTIIKGNLFMLLFVEALSALLPRVTGTAEGVFD
jgi:hypothetical protein